MRLGLDTNVLVYAHLSALADHPRVRLYLEDLLRQDDVRLVLTPGILHELVHVITDGRRFEEPVPMGEAIALARTYLSRSNVEILTVDATVVGRALELLERHRLGRRRIADTLLAAALLEHGVERLLTSNRRDFEIFQGLELIDPREQEPRLG